MATITPQLIERYRLRRTTSSEPSRTWSLATLRGRLAELSTAGSSCLLSATAALVHEAQRSSEPVVWISARDSTFYPPDFEAYGIDLRALPLVRVSSEREAARAADEVLRSGGAGLVVLDLGTNTRLPLALLTRLGGLALKHHAALLCLTQKTRRGSSLGSLVSLRGEGTFERRAFDEFTWSLEIVKDKRQGPGWSHRGVCHGPDGLC